MHNSLGELFQSSFMTNAILEIILCTILIMEYYTILTVMLNGRGQIIITN